MALKPDEGETFLREVDEELRKEQMTNFVTRYGWWLFGGALLILAAVGGWMWWGSYQEGVAGAKGTTLIEALEATEAGNRTAANAKAEQLVDSDIDGYRAAALFTRANGQIAAGNAPAAIATLRSIAADEGLDESYRQAALVRQTSLEFDSLRPQEVISRLRPLAGENSPWLGSAGEMVAIAYLKLNRADLAGPVFARVARDENVPSTIRDRAAGMAGSLGVSVEQNPQGQPAAAPAR
ncbi:MAG TPA: tetratricopeptide repeat protein [Allosphingosinicella sp.]|nr:tetratricopeptide repeat protein [Allosphingosinicella sp.]